MYESFFFHHLAKDPTVTKVSNPSTKSSTQNHERNIHNLKFKKKLRLEAEY